MVASEAYKQAKEHNIIELYYNFAVPNDCVANLRSTKYVINEYEHFGLPHPTFIIFDSKNHLRWLTHEFEH